MWASLLICYLAFWWFVILKVHMTAEFDTLMSRLLILSSSFRLNVVLFILTRPKLVFNLFCSCSCHCCIILLFRFWVTPQPSLACKSWLISCLFCHIDLSIFMPIFISLLLFFFFKVVYLIFLTKPCYFSV